MSTKIILFVSLVVFIFSIGFSIYYSNSIVSYNYLYNQKLEQNSFLSSKKTQLLDLLNTHISEKNLIESNTTLTPINKSFP